VKSSCELGNEPSGSIKMLGICRVAAQLAASRVVLGSTELVSYLFKGYCDELSATDFIAFVSSSE
jgi:hypothetical protein